MLTKWPRLLVAGEPVTREQANDILIRSNSRYGHTNDPQWLRLVAREYGIEVGRSGCFFDFTSAETVYERLGVLRLHHLTNDRVMSSWIGGPKGWCDWDGRIGCSTYNIGKWPERHEVQEDLDAIAGAWPFLRMDVQLVTDEGEGDLAAMWVVRDGAAVFVEPGDQLPLEELTEGAVLQRLMSSPFAERGVSLERLREALTQVSAR